MPQIGRFMAKDILRVDSLNRYLYVVNNPVNYIDLDGLFAQRPHLLDGFCSGIETYSQPSRQNKGKAGRNVNNVNKINKTNQAVKKEVYIDQDVVSYNQSIARTNSLVSCGENGDTKYDKFSKSVENLPMFWWQDAEKLNEAVSMLRLELRQRGSMEMATITGNKMRVLRHLMLAFTNNHWDFESMERYETINTGYGNAVKYSDTLTEKTFESLIDYHQSARKIPGNVELYEVFERNDMKKEMDRVYTMLMYYAILKGMNSPEAEELVRGNDADVFEGTGKKI